MQEINLVEDKTMERTNITKKDKKENNKACAIIWAVGAVVWMISAGINIFEIKSTGTFDNFAITQVGMAVFSFAMSFYYSKLYKKEKSEK